MRIEYIFADPTGNCTLLADTPVPEALQPAAAAALMELEPEAEQVGFISRAEGCDISLRMAGGEFCGNAAISAAAVFAQDTGMNEGIVTVRVSGAPDPLKADMRLMPDGSWRGTVAMPSPLSAGPVRLPGYGILPAVVFGGITHIIIGHPLPRSKAEMLAAAWCGHLGADALGLMFLDMEAGEMTPLVYVPAADTMFWESSCASGTAAVGAWLSYESGENVAVSLKQPGGTLTIDASRDGRLRLTGSVMFRRRTEADITGPGL